MGSGEERRPLCVSELSAFEARGGEGGKKKERCRVKVLA